MIQGLAVGSKPDIRLVRKLRFPNKSIIKESSAKEQRSLASVYKNRLFFGRRRIPLISVPKEVHISASPGCICMRVVLSCFRR